MDKCLQNLRLPRKGFFGWLATKILENLNRPLELNAVKLCDLKPNHQILELGFGPGLGLEAAYKQIKDGPGKIWGLDLSPYMHEVAGHRLKDAIDSGKVELCLGSVMEIPFEANTFDRVFHCNCFCYWPNFNKGAQEIYRVMKPESLMVTTLNQAQLNTERTTAMDKCIQNLRLPRKGFFGWLTTKFLENLNRPLELNAVKLCDLKPNHQILEIGFGPGLGLEAAYKQIKDGPGKIWGLDLSPYMHEVAGHRLKDAIDSGKVELCLGSVMEIPFEANTFDRVFHCNCFCYWPNFNKGAQEIYRVMKPESLMVTTLNQAQLNTGIRFGTFKYGNPDWTFYMEVLSKNGFSNVHLKKFSQRGKCFEAIFASVGRKEN